jgi:hypothetical protein
MSKRKEEPTVSCPSCGEENKIFVAFCKQCGARLYKDGAGPNVAENEAHAARRKAVRSFISTVEFLVLAGLCVLIFWPLPSEDIPVTGIHSTQVEQYLSQIRSLRGTGQEIPEISLPQRYLNAFLGQNAEPDQGKLLGAELSEDRILVMSREPLLGPLSLSSRLELSSGGDASSPVMPVNFYVGQLPLPLALVPLWTQRISGAFDLQVEPELLEELRIRSVSDSRLVVGSAAGL